MFSMVRVITQVISVTKCTTAQLSMFVKMHFLLSWHVMSPRRVFIRFARIQSLLYTALSVLSIFSSMLPEG